MRHHRRTSRHRPCRGIRGGPLCWCHVSPGRRRPCWRVRDCHRIRPNLSLATASRHWGTRRRRHPRSMRPPGRNNRPRQHRDSRDGRWSSSPLARGRGHRLCRQRCRRSHPRRCHATATHPWDTRRPRCSPNRRHRCRCNLVGPRSRFRPLRGSRRRGRSPIGRRSHPRHHPTTAVCRSDRDRWPQTSRHRRRPGNPDCPGSSCPRRRGSRRGRWRARGCHRTRRSRHRPTG